MLLLTGGLNLQPGGGSKSKAQNLTIGQQLIDLQRAKDTGPSRPKNTRPGKRNCSPANHLALREAKLQPRLIHTGTTEKSNRQDTEAARQVNFLFSELVPLAFWSLTRSPSFVLDRNRGWLESDPSP